jgi:ankyrin repeat protein
LLIETYPEGLTVKDLKGQVPLHMTVGDVLRDEAAINEGLELLACVLKAFPAASQIRDLKKRTPLEYAIMKQNFRHATFLLQNHGGAIPAAHASKPRPILQVALQFRAKTVFLRLLISKVDGCAEVEDAEGNLPLHVCINKRMPFAVVEMILNAFPQAVRAADSDNLLPLTLELQKQARYNVVRLLVEKYPESVAMITSMGLLPIHYAVSNAKVTTQVLQFLNEQYPKSLAAVLPNGDSLLHHALDSSTISEVAIKWIMKKW